MAARRSAAALLNVWVVFALILLGSFLAGCYNPADPDMYPLRLQTEHLFGGLTHFADLNGDGHDEALAIAPHAEDEGHVGVLMYTLSGHTIEQINVPASYRLTSDGRPYMLDLDGDERLEVIVPLVREDSLFARVPHRGSTSSSSTHETTSR